MSILNHTTPTKEELYLSILKQAAEEWDIDYRDADVDIGRQFDPIVRFLAGACASELERVYQHQHDMESRLQERLAQTLLPEHYHLPKPAHALASAQPVSNVVVIDETTQLLTVSTGEEDPDVVFSPVFNTRLAPVAIRVLATEEKILVEQGAGRNAPVITDTTAGFLLGVEVLGKIETIENLCLYFDLRGRNTGDTETPRFFAALAKSRVVIGNQEVPVGYGLPPSILSLEDYLDGDQQQQQEIRAYYDRHFLHFEDVDLSEFRPQTTEAALRSWFRYLPQASIETELAKVDPGIKNPLIWISIRLPRAIEIAQLATRLILRFNVFPVLNRRLCGTGNGEQQYFRDNSIKWIDLLKKDNKEKEGRQSDPFLSIRRVYGEKNQDQIVFEYKPYAHFKTGHQATFTVRYGGVGRWDNYNAWRRLAYIVKVLQDDYEHNELIQNAASKLSLEDIHHLLGGKIEKNLANELPSKNVYVLLHTGNNTGLRVRVEYWTSSGSAGNDKLSKTRLRCISKNSGEFEPESLMLVTTSTGARDPLNGIEQLHALKGALVRRGRIVTREDVKTFCEEKLGNHLTGIHIRDSAGIDPRHDFGMTRILEVRLRPQASAKDKDWEAICHQLQQMLEQQASSAIPFKVRLDPDFI